MPQRTASPPRHRRRPAARTHAKGLTLADITRVDHSLRASRNEHRNRALFFLQLATGLRVGELAALDVGHVLHRSVVRRQFRLEPADTQHRRPRTIYLENAKITAALITYLRHRRPALDYDPGEPLFLGQKPSAASDGRLSSNALSHLFEKLYSDAGVAGASAESGRRWFITQLARAGVRPQIIQQRAGHAFITTTRRYLTAARTDERRAVRAVQF